MSKPKKSQNIDLPKLEFEFKQPERLPLSRKYELGRSTSIVGLDQKKVKLEYSELTEIRLLKEGQFGIVSEMFHKPSGLTFAVKRIDENTLNDSDGISNGDVDIMDLLVPLHVGDFKYLVKFYGALHADGAYWIITELMDSSIDDFYKVAFENDLSISELFISKVSYAVLSALHYMKSKGYMHRDIKPSNMLINRTGEIKVCDFGIAGKTENSISKTMGRGCRPYMPPEKINENLSKNGYTIKSDVWSLGISLIEIATSIHPYENLNYFEQIKAIVDGPKPRLDNTSKKFSQAFCDFIDCCVKKNESDRLKPIELLEHQFIKDYNGKHNDRELISKVMTIILNQKKDT